MEVVSIRLDDGFSKKITSLLKEFNYSTKTEFIRDSIRGKVAELEKKKWENTQWEKLLSMRGTLKGKTPFKNADDFINWRHNEGSKDLGEYFDKKFDNKK